MKKFLTSLLLMAALFSFSACDDDPAEGEARTEFKYKFVMNNDAKDLLKINWISAGWSTSMAILKWTIENEDDLPNGGNFVGKDNTMMDVSISCELKDPSKLEDKTYTIMAYLMCDVTCKDADGNTLKRVNFLCGNPLNGKKFSKSEMISNFGGEKPYTMLFGVSVKGTTIEIVDEKTDPGKYGTIPMG